MQSAIPRVDLFSREAAFPLPGGEREASEAKQVEGRESLAMLLCSGKGDDLTGVG